MGTHKRDYCKPSATSSYFSMAPLTRSVHYELPELSLVAPRVESKDIQASSYPIALAHSEIPRLVSFKNKSGTCSSCSKSSTQSCADCCGMVFYCDADCQTAHWPKHKDMCHDLEDIHLTEAKEVRDNKVLDQITKDLGEIISSDFKSLNYKKDPKLTVQIEDSASFGDYYDVSENSDYTIRSFHPGTYKCTSVTPDQSCTPVTIYHHESVDPAKVVKQCVLMSKDFFEHTDVPNQITMPDWCNWESEDEEYIPSDSESETDEEVSETELVFADFVGRVFDDKPAQESDSEDHEYDPVDSDSEDCVSSDESDVSDHEVDYLISENNQYISDIPQKRQSIAPTSDMEVAEDGEDAGEDSDAETFKDFKEKVLESEHKYASDIEDSDYLPYSDSDTDSDASIPDRDISDSEKCISDNEIESMLESSKDIRDMKEEMYDEFVDNIFDIDHIEESDAEDEDYVPADEDSASSEEDEISDSEEKCLLEESSHFTKNLYGKRQSVQTVFYDSESEGDSEVSSEEELYEDFMIHTEAKHNLSDTEDIEYIPEDSDSESSSSSYDEMDVSDAESDALVIDSKDDVKQVLGHKRKCRPSEDEASQDSDKEAEMESDDELYNDFRSKLIVSNPSKIKDLGGSDDDEFVPAADSQDESEDEAQFEGFEASNKSEEEMDVSDNEINGLELSSDEEHYENFKDEVCVTQRKVLAPEKLKSNNPRDNKELIYFMDSQYASSLKESLKIENGSEIDQSFIMKNGSESSGIAVNMKVKIWRSAHAFEDFTLGKYFALVVSTDTWEHLSNNHDPLEAHYPDQQWSSVAETELKFQMKDFVC